jgi:hypothetical protein
LQEFEVAKRKAMGLSDPPSISGQLLIDDSDDVVFVRRGGKVASKQFRKESLRANMGQLLETDEFATSANGPWQSKSQFFIT